MKKHSNIQKIICTTLAFVLTLSHAVPTRGDDMPGDGAPFTSVYAFGDSLTDTGNFFALAGAPGAPYYEGRFTNGKVWIEYLALAMGLDSGAIHNYAVGGATTGRDNGNDVPGVIEFPGLQDQLDDFEQDLDGKGADKRALYAVWAGANDFVSGSGENPGDIIANGVQKTALAVMRLYQAGARRIMVVNLPDLGLTPMGAATSPEGLSYLSALYNLHLDAALDSLEALGIETVRVDSSALLADMVGYPADYGFSNVTVPYLYASGDVSEFLFWDVIHPTTLGHYFVAEEAMAVLKESFPHVWVTPRQIGMK